MKTAAKSTEPSAPSLLRSSRFEMTESDCPEGCGNTVTHPKRFPARRCDECREREIEAHRLAVEEDEKRKQHKRLQQIRSDLPEFLSRAGVPDRYQRYTRQSWEAKYKPWTDSSINSIHEERFTLYQISSRWIAQENRPDDWLAVFFGKHGRRKTSLGTSLVGEALVNGLSCLWIDAESWIDALEYGMREPSWNDPDWFPTAEVFKRAANAERLLIDDLGAIRAGRTGRRDEQDWWKERLALLLRHRESWLLPTIVTSNMTSLGELAHINHSLPSRLTVPMAFKIAGKDQRLMRDSA